MTWPSIIGPQLWFYTSLSEWHISSELKGLVLIWVYTGLYSNPLSRSIFVFKFHQNNCIIVKRFDGGVT